MKLKPRTQLTLGVAAVTLIVLGIALPRAHSHPQAPPLPRVALRGAAVTIAQLHGHAVAITFFAGWCPGCHTEAAALARFAKNAGADRVIGVAYDDSRSDALRLARRSGWSFPLLADPTGSFGAAYGLSNLPTTVIVKSSGEVVTRSFGPETVSRLAAQLRYAG